jgi:hypothetical protein
MRAGRGLAIGLAVTITVAAGSIAAASVISIRDADRATGSFSPVQTTVAAPRDAGMAGPDTTAPTTPEGTSGATGATGPSVRPSDPTRATSGATPSGDSVTDEPATVDPQPPAPSTTTEPSDDDTTTSTTEPDDD